MVRTIKLAVETWQTRSPFCITGYTFTTVEVLVVEITEQGCMGRGEAFGLYYLNETAASLLAQAKTMQQALELGADRAALQTLLPAGGARNALDCALWDLEAKLSGQSIWQYCGVVPQPITSSDTLGMDSINNMAAAAQQIDSPVIKIKLTDEQPLERVRAIRAVQPEATLIVDVNQGWTFAQLQTYTEALQNLGVEMIEQPLPRGKDQVLDTYDYPLCRRILFRQIGAGRCGKPLSDDQY